MATITEEDLKKLNELADLQHPHLKGDNHTRTLIKKVFDGEKLSTEEAFDCGKYYQRMLTQLESINDKDSFYLHSILAFKWSIKS